MTNGFTWRDAGRTVAFGAGLLAEAPARLAERGFEHFDLLTTERAAKQAPGLADAAARAHVVAAGPVPQAAAELLPDAGRAERLVACGGGRVIDTAKAVAAVSGASVAALPTTLSGAEMTGIHRLPAGAEERARGLVRPEVVLADAEAMTSQPEERVRASAMNALGHGGDSLATPFANPVSRMLALRGAALIAGALDQRPEERDRAGLALGSLLCGYAIDSALFALHHVVCQTLVRVLGIPHAETNAAFLPESMAALARRAPEELARFAAALGTDPGLLRARLRALGGEPLGIGKLGGDEDRLDEALDAIEARAELRFTPDPPDRSELREMIASAW